MQLDVPSHVLFALYQDVSQWNSSRKPSQHVVPMLWTAAVMYKLATPGDFVTVVN